MPARQLSRPAGVAPRQCARPLKKSTSSVLSAKRRFNWLTSLGRVDSREEVLVAVPLGTRNGPRSLATMGGRGLGKMPRDLCLDAHNLN
jgi:hypothetical protein